MSTKPPDEFGQIVFELRVRARVAAEQMRAAAAGAVALRAFSDRGDQFRMRGEAEIVVAGEADDLAAVDCHVRGARRVGGTTMAAQTARVDFLEAFGERVEQMH